MGLGPPPSFSHDYHYFYPSFLPHLLAYANDDRAAADRYYRICTLPSSPFWPPPSCIFRFLSTPSRLPILSVSANGAWIGKGFGTACNLPSSFHACAASGTSTVTSRPRGEINGECLGLEAVVSEEELLRSVRPLHLERGCLATGSDGKGEGDELLPLDFFK